MKNKVLDSCALIALLFNEHGADDVEAILSAAASANKPALISSVNWSEVLYICLRRNGADGFARAREFARTMPIEIVPVDIVLAEAASEFKAGHRIALADAFAAALAKIKKAELVTGDREFQQVEDEIKIGWLK